MVSLDLFLFHEFGLTSLTNVQICAKYYDYSQPKIRVAISGNILSQQVGLCKQMFFYVVHKNSFCAVSVCLQGLQDFM